jgi:hypothetical protein
MALQVGDNIFTRQGVGNSGRRQLDAPKSQWPEKMRTSAAEAEKQKRTLCGTAEAVPLSKTIFKETTKHLQTRTSLTTPEILS